MYSEGKEEVATGLVHMLQQAVSVSSDFGAPMCHLHLGMKHGSENEPCPARDHKLKNQRQVI